MHLTPHGILCNPSSFIFHVDFIPSHSSLFGDIELHLIPISRHQCNIIVHTEFMTTYITNISLKLHAKIYPRSSFTIHESHHSCKFIHLILYKCILRHTYITKQYSSQINECQRLSTCNSIQSSTTHNHNSYTKIPKKIYYHETKLIAVMRDTFFKLQTSNRRSNRSNHKIACYEPHVKI